MRRLTSSFFILGFSVYSLMKSMGLPSFPSLGDRPAVRLPARFGCERLYPRCSLIAQGNSDRDLDEQSRAGARRPGALGGAAQCLHAVAQPGQTGPLGGVGPADTVVA